MYFSLLLPAIIMEILTLLSYIQEIFKPINKKAFQNNAANINKRTMEKNKWYSFKNIWLNPEYYKLHKDDVNLKNLTKISK